MACFACLPFLGSEVAACTPMRLAAVVCFAWFVSWPCLCASKAAAASALARRGAGRCVLCCLGCCLLACLVLCGRAWEWRAAVWTARHLTVDLTLPRRRLLLTAHRPCTGLCPCSPQVFTAYSKVPLHSLAAFTTKASRACMGQPRRGHAWPSRGGGTRGPASQPCTCALPGHGGHTSACCQHLTPLVSGGPVPPLQHHPARPALLPPPVLTRCRATWLTCLSCRPARSSGARPRTRCARCWLPSRREDAGKRSFLPAPLGLLPFERGPCAAQLRPYLTGRPRQAGGQPARRPATDC